MWSKSPPFPEALFQEQVIFSSSQKKGTAFRARKPALAVSPGDDQLALRYANDRAEDPRRLREPAVKQPERRGPDGAGWPEGTTHG